MKSTEAFRPCKDGGCDHGIHVANQTVTSVQYERACPNKIPTTHIHVTMDKDFTAVQGANLLEEDDIGVSTSTDIMHHKAAFNQWLKAHGIKGV